MTLTEYILENVSLFDYYDNFITTLDDRFKEYSYNNSKLVLCYFKDHEDINPSMGWIHDKHNRDIKVCHCFGCGRTANVVRLHQMLCSQWLNKELTEKDACYDLAQLFGVSLDEFGVNMRLALGENEDFKKHILYKISNIVLRI